MHVNMMTRKERFVSELQKYSPDFKVAFKDESLLMKILAVVLFFNPGFKTNYTTTIGNTLYFPSRENYESRSEMSVIITLAHEFQHVQDNKKYGLLFKLGYLFPICLLPLAFLTFFLFPWWVSLLLCLVTAAPLPSPWRKIFELSGYTMSLFTWHELAGEKEQSTSLKINEMIRLAGYYSTHFTSFDYYLMWPFGVQDELEMQVDRIISGDLEKSDDIFGKVAEALKNSK